MTELTLREIRLKLGMTMDEMAEVINVPKPSYSYWESRNRTPEGAMEKVQKLYDDAMEHMDDGKKRKAKAVSKNTFCRINPLDRESWKVKMENKVIMWK